MIEMNYAVRFSRTMHFALRLKVGPHYTAFIRHGEKGGRGGKGPKHIFVDRLPNKEFVRKYPTEDVEANVVVAAARLRDKKSLGYYLSEEALAHLNHLINKEPLMAKFQQPDTGVLPDDAPNRRPSEAKEPRKARTPKDPNAPKTPKAPKEPKEPGTSSRGPRRMSFAPEATITAVGANPARVGSVRHAIVEGVLGAATVAEALSINISRENGSSYKVGLPDLYFCFERGLIEISGVDRSILEAVPAKDGAKVAAGEPTENLPGETIPGENLPGETTENLPGETAE